MKKSEKNEIIKWANTLNDDELLHACWRAIYDCLGSQVDEMIEQDYDLVDIQERRKYEKYLAQKADILEIMCDERGIQVWEGEFYERCK